jgi:hypothetical protein
VFVFVIFLLYQGKEKPPGRGLIKEAYKGVSACSSSGGSLPLRLMNTLKQLA